MKTKTKTARGLRPFITLRVYILTDSSGEWWETIKRDGSTRYWQGATAIPAIDKEFASAAAALRYVETYGHLRANVVLHSPPVRPSITWGQTILAAVGAESQT